MICPICETRMKCMASNNLARKMQTGRRYRCPECGKRVYTVEVRASEEAVRYILKQKWLQ